MRLLFIVQKFHQEWGGAPESVRLMANELLLEGIDADVLDRGIVHADIGRLTELPEKGAVSEGNSRPDMRQYDAIVIAGPWQTPRVTAAVLRDRQPGQPLFYLPRGGLAKVEFARPRDIKKIPYLLLIERGFLKKSDGIIYSSAAEQKATVAVARRTAPGTIIPDFVARSTPAPAVQRPPQPMTFSFLANTSPRKGLLPLVEAFIGWARESGLGRQVRLIVGGSPLPSSLRYFDRVRTLAEANRETAWIEFRGQVPQHQRDAFYTETDVMIVSSSFESYGLTVIEALVKGCALLSTPDIGALEVVPAAMPLTVSPGCDAASLKAGLAQSHAAAAYRTDTDRAATRIAAESMVDAINRQARSAWHGLFERAATSTSSR